MSTLHANDHQNRSKHRKMARRKAPHPRAHLSEDARCFRPTGQIVNIGTAEEPNFQENLMFIGVRKKNTSWIAT